MKASDFNIETLMISIHKKIEEYSDFLATQIDEGNPIEHVTYPPNNGFTENEIKSLNALESNSHLKSVLRKLVADSIAGVVFDMFNLIDGTSDPENELGKWSEMALVDKSDEIEAPTDMLHDKFYETYWDWRNKRSNKEWQLDDFEE